VLERSIAVARQHQGDCSLAKFDFCHSAVTSIMLDIRGSR
jgi:hypothetical protein